jgi:hypothetical protein
VLKFQDRAIRQKKERKGIQIGKKEVLLSLFENYIVLYLKDTKDFIKKTLRSDKEFGKVTGHKMSIQKSVAFLYTRKEHTEKEIRKIIPFTAQIKYLDA